MSEFCLQLRERHLECAADVRAVPLSGLRPGESAVIAGFAAEVEPPVGRRLMDLGFLPGSQVQVVRRAPLRDPVIYRVADYEIALRRRQAEAIRVTTPE